MRNLSIRSLLVILAVTVALPIVVFVLLLLSQLNRSDEAVLERRTLREAGAISSAVGLILTDMDSTLDLVASAPELDSGDLRDFHYRTGRILNGSGKFVIVVDEGGNQMLNTRVPFGEPLGRTSDMELLGEAIRTGETVVSDVFFGQTSGRHVFNVVKPLPPSNASRARALIITKNADELAVAMRPQDLPEGWKAAVVDRQGTVLATTDTARAPVGAPVEIASRLAEPRFSGVSIDPDSNVLLGYSRVPASGWYALKWGPVGAARTSLLENWKSLLAGGSIMLVLVVSVSAFAAEKLSASITRLARMARAVGDGEAVSPIRSRITEIDFVAVALADASSKRSEAEQRANVVMRELAHRTKNLMAVLISVIRQTARHSDDVESMAKALGGRVMALGASVDLLTHGAIGRVSLRQLVETQMATFADSPGRMIIEGDDLELAGDVAQQLGMAFHELATNAAKYGALAQSGGQIRIQWSAHETDEEGRLLLIIRWTEEGGPAVREPSRKGFGQIVIKDHLEAVTRGTVTLAYEPCGLVWSLSAPLDMMTADDHDETEPS